ncbi:MAG: imidazolonepropionase [Bacteriovoracaceae bacterium]|jgi:imidazolonepropionase|nr:imidazolonepropionase [Bacteriovoracaceae bacterium]
MQIWRKFSQILTLDKAAKKDGRNLIPTDISTIQNASVVFDDETIHWIGEDNDLPEKYLNIKSKSFEGHVLTPELVDGHTHLLFGGDRSLEYSMRLNGADYAEIAKTNGGILSTMRETNILESEKLFKVCIERIKTLINHGVGTIEIKSGYGLSFQKEYELSHIIYQLKQYFAPQVNIINTYMAAHAVPKEFLSSVDYMDKVVLPLMDKLNQEEIIDCVDIFHENGYFTYNDTEKLFDHAIKLGLPFKSHADEFSDNKGALLAATKGALSADHLLCTSKDGISALAKSKTVATLLPGTGFFLGKQQANARDFLDNGVRLSLATDYNPGSCHCDNLMMIASIAAPTLKLNQTELWSAITLNAAHAVGLTNQGAIVKGLAPRFSLFKAKNIDQITYHWGKNLAVNISKL